MREWVNATVSGYAEDDGHNDVVMLSLNGPRGGKRALEVMTIEQASALRIALGEAINNLKSSTARQSDDRVIGT